MTYTSGLPGVEVVVHRCPLNRIESWLHSVGEPVTGPTESGCAYSYGTRFGSVVVTPKMEGPGGTGIWFVAGNLPWASNSDCARQIARDLKCVVWCDPGSDYPEVHPLAPVFLQVDAEGERLITLPEDEDYEGIQAFVA